MAEARRRSGDLRETVLRVVADADRPLSVLELRERLRGDGPAVAASLAFRAVRKLVDRGEIHKIWVARGYVLGGGDAGISLFCRRCGKATWLARGEIAVALDRIAGARGFAISRHIVEVSGICHECASPGTT